MCWELTRYETVHVDVLDKIDCQVASEETDHSAKYSKYLTGCKIVRKICVVLVVAREYVILLWVDQWFAVLKDHKRVHYCYFEVG